jgi:hypothetical protein
MNLAEYTKQYKHGHFVPRDNEGYEAFLTTCASCPDDQREGQWAFNVLDKLRPDLSGNVRRSTIDPFHDDDNLGMFHNWVAAAWDSDERFRMYNPYSGTGK